MGTVDLVVIATKAADVDCAAGAAIELLGAQTVVLPIQNGLGSRERVASIVGPRRVLAGVIGGFGASIVAPGHVHHHGMELVRLGECSGPVSERVQDRCGGLAPGGLHRPYLRRHRPAGMGEAGL